MVIRRNPTAGAGTSRRILLNLVRELQKQPFHVRMFSDRDQLNAFVTSDRVSSRIRCLVAAGGDGTVANLVNRHPEHPIAVLPLGTENLVARHLEIPRDGSVVADIIQAGPCSDIRHCSGRKSPVPGHGQCGNRCRRRTQTARHSIGQHPTLDVHSSDSADICQLPLS